MGWPFSGINENGEAFQYDDSRNGHVSKFIDLEKIQPGDALEIVFRSTFETDEVFGAIPTTHCEKTEFVDATSIAWKLDVVSAQVSCFPLQ